MEKNKGGYIMNDKQQLEYLDRGLVAVKTDDGVLLRWRILAPEFKTAWFNVYRDNEFIATIKDTENSNYVDLEGTLSNTYHIETNINGAVNSCSPVQVLENPFFDIPIDKPKDGVTPDGQAYTYSANDLSVGDLNGDGRYEIIVKWYPSNAKDNAHKGYTGPTYLDGYTMTGERLWRINLGVNIRSGAHYTQFLVYDFDGDGKSELICKTADGTVDGVGQVIGDGLLDHRNKDGFVLSGEEWLTLFDGETGKALDTIPYYPDRGEPNRFGDTEGNRVDRFLAGVAYFDGRRPSAFMCRGYYTRSVIASYDVRDKRLVKRFILDSDNEPLLFGQGAHSLSVADVDNDGYDEIIYGSAVVDHDGTLLYSTGFGHGDALHVGNFDPSRPGLEIFMTHETYPHEHGFEVHDAKTGKVLFSLPSPEDDIGRGVAASIDPRYPGAQLWGYAPDMNERVPGTMAFRTIKGEAIQGPVPPANFVIWWDGDLGREILDHIFIPETESGIGVIYKWNWETESLDELLLAEGTRSNNGTKGNPNIQADILGDWREEVIWRLEDSSALRVYLTPYSSDHRIYTLMHDRQYRLGIAWQNVAYNQPPHPSFYLGFHADLTKIPLPDVHLAKLSK